MNADVGTLPKASMGLGRCDRDTRCNCMFGCVGPYLILTVNKRCVLDAFGFPRQILRLFRPLLEENAQKLMMIDLENTAYYCTSHAAELAN